MNEMDLKFSENALDSNQYKLLEILKMLFDNLDVRWCALAHNLVLESVLKLKNAIFLQYKTF